MSDPLDVFKNDPTRIKTFLTPYWSSVVLGGLAFCTVCITNWATKKPVFSGIQKHILFTSSGIVSGFFWDKYREDYLADSDAVLKHYVMLHPEDFPVKERVKYADILESWTPVR